MLKVQGSNSYITTFNQPQEFVLLLSFLWWHFRGIQTCSCVDCHLFLSCPHFLNCCVSSYLIMPAWPSVTGEWPHGPVQSLVLVPICFGHSWLMCCFRGNPLIHQFHIPQWHWNGQIQLEAFWETSAETASFSKILWKVVMRLPWLMGTNWALLPLFGLGVNSSWYTDFLTSALLGQWAYVSGPRHENGGYMSRAGRLVWKCILIQSFIICYHNIKVMWLNSFFTSITSIPNTYSDKDKIMKYQ